MDQQVDSSIAAPQPKPKYDRDTAIQLCVNSDDAGVRRAAAEDLYSLGEHDGVAKMLDQLPKLVTA